jgi:hypothetical protein
MRCSPYLHGDESEVSHAAGMEPPESKDDKEEEEEDALYARDFPTLTWLHG